MQTNLRYSDYAYWMRKRNKRLNYTRTQYIAAKFFLDHEEELNKIGNLSKVFDDVVYYLKNTDEKTLNMARKWIINNDALILGNVDSHRELARDHTSTKGGGYWYVDKENNILYLYGRSEDFGQVTKEVLGAAHKYENIGDYKIVFSTKHSLNDVKKEVNEKEVF